MAQFSSAQVGVTAAASATNLSNYVLTLLTAGDIASVKMISWGGSDTSLVAQSTRWARVTNTAVTPTAIATQSSSPGITPNSSVNTYATPAAGASSPLDSFNRTGTVRAVVVLWCYRLGVSGASAAAHLVL